jgi:hypothetical protein
MINIKKKDENKFYVTVEEKDSTSEHTVSLDDDYYQKLTDRKTSKQELIKKSFDFLLEREPKESILSEFDLRIINYYFPEYEKEMKVS